MARRWAPNDGGDSDDTGEPRPSAGRQTLASIPQGLVTAGKSGIATRLEAALDR
jgi:hypothetical protein